MNDSEELEKNESSFVEQTIDNFGIIELFLMIFTMVGLFLLINYFNKLGNYPKFTASMIKYDRYFISYIFIGFVVLIKYLVRNPHLSYKDDLDSVKKFIFAIVNLVTLGIVQLIFMLINKVTIPASISFYKNIVYSITATIEEIFYRFGLTVLIAYGILLLIEKISNEKPTTGKQWTVYIIMSVITSVLFMLSHTVLYGKTTSLILMFVIGMVEAIFLGLHRSLLIAILCHAIMNVIIMGTLYGFI